MNNAPERRDPHAAALDTQLKNLGINVDAFDVANSERELKSMYHLCTQAFTNNFLYTSITLDDFLSLYRGILPAINPSLIVMLRYRDDLIGFCFTVPNFGRSTESETAIIKTIVRHPHRKFAGAGRYMLDCAHERVAQYGFRSAIHAFYKSDNVSGKLSELTSKPIRTYALFAKDISS